MAEIIISLTFSIIVAGLTLWIGWLLQRSAMFSALKKYEKWKSAKDENQH